MQMLLLLLPMQLTHHDMDRRRPIVNDQAEDVMIVVIATGSIITAVYLYHPPHEADVQPIVHPYWIIWPVPCAGSGCCCCIRGIVIGQNKGVLLGQ